MTNVRRTHGLQRCLKVLSCLPQTVQLGRLIVLGLLSMCLVIGWMPVASGQFAIPSPAEDGSKPPPGVRRIGNIETAPVEFENQVLFRVVYPIVRNRQNPGGLVPVEERAAEIEENLNRVIATDPTWYSYQGRAYSTVFDPETLVVQVVELNRDTVLIAKDATGDHTQSLLTVTDLDARYYSKTIPELADDWSTLLETELREALQARQPEAVQRRLHSSAYIALGMGVACLVVWILQRLLKWRRDILRAQHTAAENRTQAELNQLEGESAPPRFRLFNGARRQLSLELRLAVNAFLLWLSFWGQVIIVLGGLTWILSLFPQTRAIAELVWVKPASLLGIWFVVGLLNRLGDMSINRFAKAWQESEFFGFEEAQRRSLRISTIARATKGLKTLVVSLVGIVWALSVLGVPTGSVLTFGAVVAFAISLASQNLIRDLVNGFLILVEDQYAIGDIVAIGDASGLVENMNLRITQVRNGDGRLITIPNSVITQVENLTRTWSRVDLMITVAYNTDVKQALTVIRQVAQDMYDDVQWRSLFYKSPEVLGIESLTSEGMSIRVWMDTQPMQQFVVGREFRLRLRLALEEAEIEIGIPQQVMLHRGDIHLADTSDDEPHPRHAKDSQRNHHTRQLSGDVP